MAEVRAIQDKREAGVASNGTSLKTRLIGITYDDLINMFGEPVFKGGDKIFFEWVVEFDGDIFTIYDWKSPSEDFVKDKLGHDGGISFNVGGKTYAGDFEDWIERAKAAGSSADTEQEDDDLPY